MELMAVIEGLKAIKNKSLSITVYSDSKYVLDSITKGWLKTWLKTSFKGGKKNRDLWEEYADVSEGLQLKFTWVKGHAENIYNNRCDQLATSAADGGNLQIDEFYENLPEVKKLF